MRNTTSIAAKSHWKSWIKNLQVKKRITSQTRIDKKKPAKCIFVWVVVMFARESIFSILFDLNNFLPQLSKYNRQTSRRDAPTTEQRTFTSVFYHIIFSPCFFKHCTIATASTSKVIHWDWTENSPVRIFIFILFFHLRLVLKSFVLMKLSSLYRRRRSSLHWEIIAPIIRLSG